MANSLVKFSHRTKSGDKSLYWDRVRTGDDNLPFRGAYAPNYREEEFETKTARVADARNAFFDVSKPEENKNYLDVMECCFNGWFQMIYLERFWVDPEGHRTRLHYVEWVEYYIEDGSRAPFQSNGIMELSHGQQNLSGYSGQG